MQARSVSGHGRRGLDRALAGSEISDAVDDLAWRREF